MPRSYDSATVELAMTLSTLAYVDENRTATQQQMIAEINAGLEEAGYKSWQVAWGPALNADRSNLAYTARNSETGQLAVSIRGSDFSFWLNWIEDLAAIRLVPYYQFVPTASNTAQIAFGTAVGLRQVLGMQDGTKSLETFLTATPEGTPILITGHSLGGCLASALAPCVANWVGSASGLSIYTIAAPSPGNADFAAYYNTLFTLPSGHTTAFRFSTVWMWCLMPGQASIRSRLTIRLWSPVPPTSPESLAAPKPPWLGNTVSLGNLRWVAQSNYPAPSSRPSVRTEVAWNPMPSRMRCFCGKPANNMPARRIRRCYRRL